MKNIVTVGGGNGQPVILRALKKIKNINIKAIVTTMDNGGSTGRLSDEFNILPIGDIMKCIVALSPDEEKLGDFFISRFALDNKLKGHTPGNILLASMVKYCGDYAMAIETLAERVGALGEIIPVTHERTSLVALYKNGNIVKGEHSIDEPDEIIKNNKIKKISIEPQAPANEKAVQAIIDADYIFLGPGDLYTSVLANFVVDGIVAAISKTKAKIYYFMNLMSKKGQTDNMNAKEIAAEVEKYLNRKLDGIILNSEKVPENILAKYLKAGERQIGDNLPDAENIIRFPLVHKKHIFKDKNDLLYRSILKHDAKKIKKLINKII